MPYLSLSARIVFGRCRQAVCFLSPTQVIRYLNDRNAEVVDCATEGSIRVHVPFGGSEIWSSTYFRAERSRWCFSSASIIGRPFLGRDIQVLCKRLDAWDHVRVSLGVE